MVAKLISRLWTCQYGFHVPSATTETTTNLLVNLSESTSMCKKGSCTFFSKSILKFTLFKCHPRVYNPVLSSKCLVAFYSAIQRERLKFWSSCSFRKRNYPFRVRRSKTMLANGWSFVTSNFSATGIVDKMERQNPMKNNVSLSYSHHCHHSSKI